MSSGKRGRFHQGKTEETAQTGLLSVNLGFLNGERGRPGCTGRRLADRNQTDPPPRGFGGTPNPAGETPALPSGPFGSWPQSEPARLGGSPMNLGILNGERGRPGCTGRRLADRNQTDPPPRGFGGTPNPAGETPALPSGPSGSWSQSEPARLGGSSQPAESNTPLSAQVFGPETDYDRECIGEWCLHSRTACVRQWR